MMIDPTFTPHGSDPVLAMILSTISVGGGRTRLAKGFYRISHWNFDSEVAAPKLEDYTEDWTAKARDLDSVGLECEYGVCDSPEQFIERFGPAMEASPRRWVVSFCVIQKADEEPHGWRWHKWGPYIGTADPQCEYLYDEPVITSATTFHAYRAKESP